MNIETDGRLAAFTKAATALDVQLPDPVRQVLDHLAELGQEEPAPNTRQLALDLATHLGDRAAFTKARRQAVDALAAATVARELRPLLLDAARTTAWQTILEHREDVADAFGAALADDLTTLAEHAPRLPSGFHAGHADQLTPAQYQSWRQAQAAHARIATSDAALLPLYGSTRGRNGDAFTNRVEAALRYVRPPELTTTRAAWAVLDACEGRSRIGGMVGPAAYGEMFGPTAAAHAGCTFEWAGPAEVHRRADALAFACRLPVPTTPDETPRQWRGEAAPCAG